MEGIEFETDQLSTPVHKTEPPPSRLICFVIEHSRGNVRTSREAKLVLAIAFFFFCILLSIFSFFFETKKVLTPVKMNPGAHQPR